MITGTDVTVVVGSTVVIAVAVAVGAAMLLRSRWTRSITTALGVVVLSAVVVVAGTVAAVGALMLVSGHALLVLLASVLAAAVAGLAVAALLGREVQRGSHVLREMVRQISAEAPPKAGPAPRTAELARLADDLEETRARLAAARARERILEASRRELVAWVSHDLRTPLADMRVMAEALEDGVVADDETVRRYLREIRVESDRVAAMVDELFDLSRLQAGALPMSMAVLDLGEVAVSAVEPTREQARRRQVRLVVERADPAPVLGDRMQLVRAVRNLVSNGVRYTRPGGQVTVVVDLVDGDPRLTVSDQCGGIPPRDLERIFEVGYRGERARTPGPDRGTGLGLAISAGLVRAHDGRLDVAATSQDGCAFTVTLSPAPRPGPGGRTREPEITEAPDSGSPPRRSG